MTIGSAIRQEFVHGDERRMIRWPLQRSVDGLADDTDPCYCQGR